MKNVYFAISYVDDYGNCHMATVTEQWEVRFYQRRFYNVSVTAIQIA